MAEITPIVCTEDELTAARSARTALINGSRKEQITIDGDVTVWTAITLPQLNATIAGMQAYQNSIAESGVIAFRITGSKGL